MLKRIGLLLLLIPLLDALFLVVVADLLGWQLTVLLVVLTALLGVVFVQAEGRRTIRRMHRSVASGTPPTDELLDGGFLIAAGAFLLTPGLVTDGIGLVFVFPPTRYVLRRALKRWVIVPYVDRKTGGFASGTVYTAGFPRQDESASDDTVIDIDPNGDSDDEN